jgi:putative heme transporter
MSTTKARERWELGGPVAKGALLGTLLLAAGAIGVLYVLLPNLAGLDDTWRRVNRGDPWWLGLALLLEIASFAGYMALFRAVFARDEERIDWPVSYQVTMAGLGATRLFATAGLGGILLTVWVLRRAGMPPRTVTQRMTAFLVLLYGVFMLALLIGGLGLRVGLFPGSAPFGLTVIPAAFGGAVIVLALALALLPADLAERLAARITGEGLATRLEAAVANASAAIAEGIRLAIRLVERRRIGLLGAPAWWGFDIAVLWASFHAFGEPPPTAVLVVAYFTGMLANALPLPGGIGGVEGGMIGALVGFGVPGGLALVAVLTYRAFSFWLPTIPGAIAYLQLRRTVHRWEAQSASR